MLFWVKWLHFLCIYIHREFQKYNSTTSNAVLPPRMVSHYISRFVVGNALGPRRRATGTTTQHELVAAGTMLHGCMDSEKHVKVLCKFYYFYLYFIKWSYFTISWNSSFQLLLAIPTFTTRFPLHLLSGLSTRHFNYSQKAKRKIGSVQWYHRRVRFVSKYLMLKYDELSPL